MNYRLCFTAVSQKTLRPGWKESIFSGVKNRQRKIHEGVLEKKLLALTRSFSVLGALRRIDDTGHGSIGAPEGEKHESYELS